MDESQIKALAEILDALSRAPTEYTPFQLYNIVAKLDMAKAELLKRAGQLANQQNYMI